MESFSKIRFKSLFITLSIIFFISVTSYAQDNNQQNKNGISLELLGTTTAGIGLNYDYSFSHFIDLGIGTIIFIPSFPPELHAFVRWNIFDFPVSPFLACSLSYFQLTVLDGVFFPFFGRIHAGIKWDITSFLSIGTGLTYQVFGESVFESRLIAGTFNPLFNVGIAF